MKKKQAIAVYAVCYVLSALLLGFYLVTLYRGTHPHVSPEYRIFYLQDDLYLWPGADGLEIKAGEKISFDSKIPGPGQGAGHIMRLEDSPWKEPDGWTWIEDQGYCITGWQARLLFYGQPDSACQVSMTLCTPQPGGEVTVFANGEQVLFTEFPETEKTIVFDTPQLPEDGRLELEIVLGGDMATPVSVKELIFQ